WRQTGPRAAVRPPLRAGERHDRCADPGGAGDDLGARPSIGRDPGPGAPRPPPAGTGRSPRGGPHDRATGHGDLHRLLPTRGPSRLAGTELISTLAAALTICERTGAPTAGVLQNLADALRDLHDASLARRTAFAGPRSTARILLVLPAAGLALGMLLGGDPLRLLISSPIGNLLAAVGGAATVIGWWWMRRLVRRADPPATSQVDASVLLELIAG